MFPEKLSTHLCSLNPKVKRLAMAVVMDFDKEGRFCKAEFFPAVIKSHERLT